MGNVYARSLGEKRKYGYGSENNLLREERKRRAGNGDEIDDARRSTFSALLSRVSSLLATFCILPFANVSSLVAHAYGER